LIEGREEREMEDKRTTVLVVEDREDWRKTICQLLESLDFGVLEASCGQEFREHAPAADVILLDIAMPMVPGGAESTTAGLDVLLQLQEEHPGHTAIAQPIVRSMWIPEDFKDWPLFKIVTYGGWVSRNEPTASLLDMIEKASTRREAEHGPR
jgi:CheY-like chemotaxis protein